MGGGRTWIRRVSDGDLVTVAVDRANPPRKGPHRVLGVGAIQHNSTTIQVPFERGKVVCGGTLLVRVAPPESKGSLAIQFEPEEGLSFEGVEIEIVRKGFHYGTGFPVGPDGRVETTAVGGEYEVASKTTEFVQVAKQTDIQVRPRETTLVQIPAYHPRRIEVQWCYRCGEDTEWKRGESEFASGRTWRPPWDCGPLHFTISPWDGKQCTIRANNAEYFRPQPAGTQFPADDAASIEFPKAEGPRPRYGHPLESDTMFAIKVGYRTNLQGMMRVSAIRSPVGE